MLAQPRPTATESAAAAGESPPSAAETSVPAELRAKLAELEAQLAKARSAAEEWATRAAEFERARADAPERLRVIEQEIAALQQRQPLEIAPGRPPEDLATELLDAEQDLALARKEAAELDAEAARRAERRRRIPELLAAAKERLRSLDQESAAPAGESAALTDARQQLVQARRATLDREIQAHQAELASYEARGQLLVKRLDRSTLRLAALEARGEALRGALTQREQIEADRAAEQAERFVEEARALAPSIGDMVRQLAERNAELARQRAGEEGLVEKIDDVSQKLARAEESVAQVEADLAALASKIEAAGLTDSVGLLLRRQRSDAPDVGKYRRFIRMRQESIREAQLRQIELREQRRELADVDRVVQEAMTRVDPDVAPADRRRIETLLRELLETRRRYTDALIADYETYFQRLVDFDAKQQELIERTEALLSFIDERILWIPSGRVIPPNALANARDALAWLLAPRFWGQLGDALLDVLRATPLVNAAVALLLVLSIPLLRRAPARIRSLGEAARPATCADYRPTAEAFALTLLRAAWLPALLLYLGWRLGSSPSATQFTRCFAHGALAATLFWATLELPRQLLRRGGVAEAHVGWPAPAVRSLRRQLGWLAAVSVPLVFLVYALELRGEDAWQESLGRLAFGLLVGSVLIFAWRILRDSGPLTSIARHTAELSPRPWLWRLGQGVAFGLPVLLLAATLRGYYWTALQLAARLHLTIFFVFTLFVAYRLAGRWSLLARRRVAFELARERQRLRAEQLEQAASGVPDSGESVAVVEPEVDLAAVDTQTSRLLRGTALLGMLVVVWGVWADVLPAAGILREVELWSTTQTVTLDVTDASGRRQLTSEERVVPITLADLMRALLIAAAALLLIRNLPGLLEISLFRRMGVGTGERYAYATIVKYGVILVSVVLAFRAVGVGWSSIQWLVAAVGLGLGFGLQEIFANFVSGLIILFERPIRVGDTVTVGDVSGSVSRIRIRATWITSFDRKELVVPNKEFVTGRLVNWSLSDAILRVDVRVGIAYGSDTEQAIALLRRVAEANQQVLREPAPQAWFLGFGESSLDFELRCFSPDVAHLLPIRHQLHMAIDRAFREAGIEIAFPQRDLHVRSLPESWRGPEGSAL